MQGDMTEAMKSMDSGMAAAEMELRAAGRAVPAAAPRRVSAPQQPSATPGSRTKLAATAALRDPADTAVQQSHDSVAHAQKLDSSQPSAQQQTASLQIGQEGDHPVPAGSHDKAEQRSSDQACMGDTAAAAKGGLLEGEAGSNAELAAAGLPQQSIGPAALAALHLTAQQSQQAPEVQAAPNIDLQPLDMKASKQMTGVQLHVYADSSAGQAVPFQPLPASSRAPHLAASSLPAVEGQIGVADSEVHGVSQTHLTHVDLPATDGSMPVQSCQVPFSVDALPEAPYAPVGAMPCPAGPVSSAESASGGTGCASAVSSADCSEASQQPSAAVESWAADEGDFADMLKEFLVHLRAMPLFIADHV